jgi:hypothetical protein
MDMPSKRIKWKLHRIFFECGGVNQHPHQEFRGMPRSSGIGGLDEEDAWRRTYIGWYVTVSPWINSRR